MFFSGEMAELACPVFTTDELQELLSLFQSEDSVSPNSGSEGSSRAVYTVDERKRRRMVSNRESARRSRWRKKRHLENVEDEVNRLILENQLLKNSLGSALHQWHVVWGDNERLRSESVALSARLSDLYRILHTMHSH